MSVFGAAAYAAAPEAGSVIGNQAVATYTNSSGDTITVTSNKVETVVQQVAGLTMISDNSEAIAPGGKAFLPHIVTNDGNGPDSFALTATEQDSGALDTTLVFYPDANMDGVADSATPITSTPVLAPGEQYGFIIEASASSTQTGTDNIDVLAVSALDNTVTDANVDTLTISNGAIVEVVVSGVPAGWGAPVYGKLDSDLAMAMMTINAVKGVEIGAGFGSAAMRGEDAADEMRMSQDGPVFQSNFNGGVLGGISTGQDLVIRFAVKPTSSIRIERRTLNRDFEETTIETRGRHDPCVGIRAVPVGEAMAALVLADHKLRHAGQSAF